MGIRNFHIIVLLILPTLGCRASYQFQFVDAITEKPVNDVVGSVFTQGHYFGNRMFPHDEFRFCGPSSPDGCMNVDGLLPEAEFSHDFRFSRVGYDQILLSGGYSDHGWTVSSVRPGAPAESASHITTAIAEPGQVTRIKMFPSEGH